MRQKSEVTGILKGCVGWGLPKIIAFVVRYDMVGYQGRVNPMVSTKDEGHYEIRWHSCQQVVMVEMTGKVAYVM